MTRHRKDVITDADTVIRSAEKLGLVDDARGSAASLRVDLPLRTRIATIVTQMSNKPCCGESVHDTALSEWSLDVADAVIAALDPRPDWRPVEDWHGKAGQNHA